MMNNRKTRSLNGGLASVELAPMEVTCLKLAANGARSFEIAAHLAKSQGEVEFYLDSARQKLGARNRLHAIGMAVSHGLIGIDGN